MIEPRQRHALVRAAEQERSWLHVITSREDRAQLKRFVQQAHQVQLADEGVQAELAAFTGHREHSTDGIPFASAGARTGTTGRVGIPRLPGTRTPARQGLRV